MNFRALTEIHEGIANLTMAKTLLSRGWCHQAEAALRDAEAHYATAVEAIEESNPDIRTRLNDLLAEIMTLRSFLQAQPFQNYER